MRTRTSILATLLFVLTSASAFAQEVTLTSNIRPMYLGVNGARFHEGAVTQSDVYVGLKNGYYADAWWSTGFDSKLNFGKEVDLTFGRMLKFGKVALATDANYFIVQGKDVIDLNADVTYRYAFARLEAYTPSQRGGPGKGLMMSVGMRAIDEPLFETIERVRVSASQWVRRDTGCFGFDSAWLYQGNMGVGFVVTPSTTLRVGTRWSIPLNSPHDSRKGEWFWETGVIRKF